MSTAEQMDLLSLARSTDPETSREAALSLDVKKRKAEVLTAIRLLCRYQSTFTDGEVADFMQAERNCVAARRKNLERDGLVAPVWCELSGKPEKRRGRSGRNEGVYMLTDLGRSAVTP